MKNLNAPLSFARHMKPVHREISGRPHHTFKEAYVQPNNEHEFTTVATIQSGGVSSVSVTLDPDRHWVASEPDTAIFLDDDHKALKPSEPRPMTAEEATRHHAISVNNAASCDLPFVSPLTVLHRRILAAIKRGVPRLRIARFLEDGLNKKRSTFKGYSFEYRAIIGNMVTTYQALEAA